MSTVKNVNSLTLIAAGDMSSNKFRGGVYSAGNKVTVAGAGVYPQVIIMDTPDNTDEHVNCYHVASSVKLMVQAGGSVTDADYLTTDGSGDFVVGTSGDKTCLQALEAASSGEVFMALVIPADTVA